MSLKRFFWICFLTVVIFLGFCLVVYKLRYHILGFFKLKTTVSRVIKDIDRNRPEVREMFFRDKKKLTLIAFKKERKLEVWQNDRFVKSYDFTAFSGEIGPKLRGGDRQIPEGVYKAEYLNPNSSYHLSVKVGYPNDFEKKKAVEENRKDPGGDIFIHGKSATIGCIPVGDKAIEEIFYITAMTGISKTHIIISPYDMRNGRDDDIERSVTSKIAWMSEVYDNIYNELEKYD